MGTLVLSFIMGVFAGLLANYLSPPFRNSFDAIFSFIFDCLDPDRYDLNGRWEHQYSEPDPKNPEEWIETVERVTLRHVGSILTGTGKTDAIPREFTYRCRAHHSLVFGTYKKKGEK
ncbi:MAG: hypothetical protein QM442_08885, partial [Spirochaetota bacterium]|nr:hypothetical protein [Spirochaetota bacterium]